MTRPAEHLVHGLAGPIVVIDGKVCAHLNRLLGLDKLRAEIRGQDAQLDQALLAIKLAGTAYASSATGKNQAPQPEPVQPSKQHTDKTMSTTTAAKLLNVTDRAIRRAITEKRLKATSLDGRWRIDRDDLEKYWASR